MNRAILFLAIALSMLSCRPGADTAEGTARRFVDQHYVEMNLEAAKAFSTGLATHKVEEEQALIQGQRIDESTRKPQVHYRLLETKGEGEDRVSFVFEGEIRVEDAGSFTRKWLVTAKREGNGWKVSNYQDFD